MVLTTTNSWQILPVEPVATGDFTNIATNNAADATYTRNGAPATMGDIIDLNSSGNIFDPENDVDADGIIFRSSGQFFLRADLVSELLANGFTLTMDVFCVSENTSLNLKAASADVIYSASGIEPGDPGKWWASLENDGSASVEEEFPLAPDQVHRIAVTCTGERSAIAIDGTLKLTNETPALDPAVIDMWFSIVDATEQSRLRSFAFYEPVADADLPALSAL